MLFLSLKSRKFQSDISQKPKRVRIQNAHDSGLYLVKYMYVKIKVIREM